MDKVSCKCGSITIYGGQEKFGSDALHNYSTFLRVADDGQERAIVFQENKPTKSDLIKMLDQRIEMYEELPQNALCMPINHYDLLSVLILLSALFKAESS